MSIAIFNYNICAIGVSTLKDLAKSEGARIRASFGWSVVGSNDLSSIKAAKVNNKLHIHLENPTKNQWFNVCDACNEVDLMAA